MPNESFVTNCFFPLSVTVIGGIVLLFLEHRTGFFQKQISKTQRKTRVPQPSPPLASLNDKESKDWGNAVATAKITFAKIHGLRLDELHLVNWKVNLRKTEVRIEIEYPDPRRHYHRTRMISADSKGRILKEGDKGLFEF